MFTIFTGIPVHIFIIIYTHRGPGFLGTTYSHCEGNRVPWVADLPRAKKHSSFEQCFILFCSFPLLFVFVVGGLGFELSVFVAGWRHALRSEWPLLLILLIILIGLSPTQDLEPEQ